MISKKTLDNGLRIIVKPNKHVRSVSLGVWIRVGSIDETIENNGISHFIEHMLFKGTKERTAKDIAFEIDRIGGELNAFTSRECTSIYTEVLDDYVDEALAIMADMLQNSTFDESEIQKEKTVIIDEISLYEDSPEDIVDDMFHEAVYDGSTIALPISGRVESVNGFTREELMTYFDKYYIPENMVISAAGNFDPVQLFKLIDQYFGNMKKQGEANTLTLSDVFQSGFVHRRKHFELNHCSIGFKTISYHSDDLYSLLLMNNIIGGSVSSRLFQNIRERNGLTYTVESSPIFYAETGVFNIYFTMVNDNVDQLAEVLVEELTKVKAGDFTEDELKRAKQQMVSSYLLGLEYTGDIMNWLGKTELFGDPIRKKEEVLALIDKASLADMKRLAADMLDGSGGKGAGLVFALLGKAPKKSAVRMYKMLMEMMK